MWDLNKASSVARPMKIHTTTKHNGKSSPWRKMLFRQLSQIMLDILQQANKASFNWCRIMQIEREQFIHPTLFWKCRIFIEFVDFQMKQILLRCAHTVFSHFRELCTVFVRGFAKTFPIIPGKEVAPQSVVRVSIDQEGHVQLLLPHCYLMRVVGARKTWTWLWRESFQWLVNSAPTPIVVNQTVPGHAR